MQERIDRLLKSIAELRERASRCDPDFRAEFHTLANEMQRSVHEMQDKLNAMAAAPASGPSVGHASAGPEPVEDEHRIARHQKLGKLLLVEDEEMLRRLLAEFLEDEGFAVVQAPGCSAALRELDRDPDVDCVLSDVRMPDGTGFDLAQDVLTRRPGVKVALISGYSDQLPATLARRGVQLFRKPLALADLAIHVKELCAA